MTAAVSRRQRKQGEETYVTSERKRAKVGRAVALLRQLYHIARIEFQLQEGAGTRVFR